MPEPKLMNELADANKTIARLEAQVSELDAYSGAVAHELKNPIGNILAYADDLRGNYGIMQGAEIEQHLEMILTQSRRVNSIIDELLLLANVNMNEQIEIAPVQMGPIIEDLLNQLADDIRAADARVILPDTWHDAYGYSPWVERIWYNYLTNGLKYGGTPPHLTLGSHQDTHGLVHFWVADQGQGLSPEAQAQLFQPFPQIAKQGPKSNGLGLSIVKQIAERLNGQVGIESAVGSGSKFYFALPSAG